jgi:hypothetical protein
VVVKDVDECTYRGEDPQFLNHCLYPAKCVNAACGSGRFHDDLSAAAYECVCDHAEYEEDGKLGCRKISAGQEVWAMQQTFLSLIIFARQTRFFRCLLVRAPGHAFE